MAERRANIFTRALSCYSLIVTVTVTVTLTIGATTICYAQSTPIPTKTPPDTLSETFTQSDSLSRTASDSADVVVPDTLTQQLLLQQRDMVKIRDSLNTPLSFSHLAARRLLHPSANLRRNIDNAFYHDAGDFFTSERGFFTVDYFPTPMRHTVIPYGLNSAQVTPILDGQALAPLEHLPGQDGLIDYNEVPTAPVRGVTPLHGPLAAFFGGDNGIAGVYLEKITPSGFTPESRLEVQKGTFGYAYTKGIIMEKTPSGFSYLMALGYRKADYGILATGRDDDLYHQYWEFSAPLSRKLRATSKLRLYRRQGEYLYRPQQVAARFDRHRRDRDISVNVEYTSDKQQTISVLFRRQSNESSLRESLFSTDFKLNRRQNSVTLSRTIQAGRTLYTTYATVLRSYFDITEFSYQRDEQSAGLRAILPLFSQSSSNASQVPDSLALNADSNTDTDTSTTINTDTDIKTDGEIDLAGHRSVMFGEISIKTITKYRSIPKLNFGLRLMGDKSDVTIAVGLTPVFPTQYQRFLPDEILFVGVGSSDLRQAGNPALVAEKQYTASVVASQKISSLTLHASLVGGSVTDGIRWRRDVFNGAGTFIQPVNEDYRFATLSLRGQMPLSEKLLWSVSTGFYHVDYDNTPAPTYTPQYNMQTSLTLNHYVEKLELFLSGHAELSLPGPYLSNSGEQLGRNLIINARMSFRIKNFNFHYMFENLNSISYPQREQYQHLGRYTWYWITWDFLD